MKKDKISLKEKLIGKAAEFMVDNITTSPEIAKVKKPLKDSKVAFITTAGVHLRDDIPFDTDGDYTFRILPSNAKKSELVISHEHYDKEEALKDINCIYPIEILKDLEREGYIGGVSPKNIGLMGYIPDTDPLVNISAPEIADILVEDGVDIALLAPG